MDQWDSGSPRPRQMGEPMNFAHVCIGFIIVVAVVILFAIGRG